MSELHLSPDIGAWLEARQALLPVAATTSTPSGQTVDWIPLEAQAEKLATPPPSPAHATPEDPARPTKTAVFDTAAPGPEAHVPVLRPNLSGLHESLSLQDFLAKRGGLIVNRLISGLPVDPDSNADGYFHAMSSQSAVTYGADAWLNCWQPTISSSSIGDHSISQAWLQSSQTGTLQSIEAGLTVDASVNGDTANHLFTYFTTNGYAADGDNEGGYNRVNAGWVQIHPSIYPGIRIDSVSGAGGTQFEVGLKFRLWQGNWWIGVNENHSTWTWLGYYPGTLFAPTGLGTRAQWLAFGGEIFAGLANPCATTDQMGSGRHAASGWTRAAYQRLIHRQSTKSGTIVNFAGLKIVDAGNGTCPLGKYTISLFPSSGPQWGSYQFLGGPSI